MLRWARHFCMITCQHGYKYVALPGQYLVERVFWGVVIILAMLMALYLMWSAWKVNVTRPTIIAVESNHFPIWNVPFPAVTLCELNKIQRPLARKMINKWQLPTGVTSDEVFEDMRMLTELMNDNYSADTVNLTRLQNIFDSNGLTVDQVIKELVPRCEQLFVKCKFKGRLRPCKTLFTKVRTPEGYCCSFNYYGEKEKSKSKTAPAAEFQEEAHRMSACGYQMGLSVLMHTRYDTYHATLLASHGFKVLIHDSYDYPDETVPGWILPAASEMLMSLSPAVMYTAPRAKSMDIASRGCLFQHELALRYLKSYTYHNCLTECRYNMTLRLCGCAPFYMPRTDTNRVCNLTDVPCLAKHKHKLETLIVDFNETIGAPIKQTHLPCHCVPECRSVSYKASLSEDVLDRNMATNDKEFFDDVKDASNHSVLHVFFMDLVGTRYRRDSFYTWHNLLASFGGILSLFLGFSFMTGFETIYFFTLRVFFYLIRTQGPPVPSSPNARGAAPMRIARNRRLAWSVVRPALDVASRPQEPQKKPLASPDHRLPK